MSNSGDETVYAVPPIDWWDGWTPLGDAIVGGAGDYTSRLLIGKMARAVPLFTAVGWEGDGSWRVAPLPAMHDGVQEIDFLVAVKQANNGETFLLSPKRLPWLEEYRAR